MQRSFRKLTGEKILSVFPGCIPCHCYHDSAKILDIPRYDVDVQYGRVRYSNDNRLITEITVTCDCCGAKKTYNVEYFDMYSSSISW